MAEEQYYEALQKIVNLKFDLLNHAIESVKNQEISNYPIIVVSPVPIELGVALSSQTDLEWHIHVSTLEELVVKNIVADSKVDDFRSLYKSKSATHYCFFLIDDDSANFVFHPNKG